MNELNIPRHVAIIMDGNRRWAKQRGKKASYGHLAGSKNLEKLATHILDTSTEFLSVFAFSTENFKRDKEEVDYLMDLLVDYFTNKFKTIIKKDIKVIISGSREHLRDDVIKAIDNIEEKSKDGKSGTFNICINYGGKKELVDTTKKIAEMYRNDEIELDDIDEEFIRKNLYNDLPPIDLLIRTSGEQRISNFMIYQLAYSEFYFTDKYFPDFNDQEYDKILLEYQKRNRRFGGN